MEEYRWEEQKRGDDWENRSEGIVEEERRWKRRIELKNKKGRV